LQKGDGEMTNYIIKRFKDELEQLKALYVKYEAVRDKKDKLKSYTKTYQKYSKTEDNYAIKIIALRTVLIEKMQEDKKISNITAKNLENFINAYMDENEREIKAFEEKIKSEKQIIDEEMKEIIFNSNKNDFLEIIEAQKKYKEFIVSKSRYELEKLIFYSESLMDKAIKLKEELIKKIQKDKKYKDLNITYEEYPKIIDTILRNFIYLQG
jgi:hypothetical protein